MKISEGIYVWKLGRVWIEIINTLSWPTAGLGFAIGVLRDDETDAKRRPDAIAITLCVVSVLFVLSWRLHGDSLASQEDRT